MHPLFGWVAPLLLANSIRDCRSEARKLRNTFDASRFTLPRLFYAYSLRFPASGGPHPSVPPMWQSARARMKQRLRISLGTGCVLALTLVAAIWLTGRLASARFERTLFELSFSRLDTIAGDVSRKVELGLTLGLDLAELADLQALAERTARLDEIVDTEISDERGIVLFAADRSRIGLPQANQTIMTQGPAPGDVHQTAAVVIRNSCGQIVGQAISPRMACIPNAGLR